MTVKICILYVQSIAYNLIFKGNKNKFDLKCFRVQLTNTSKGKRNSSYEGFLIIGVRVTTNRLYYQLDQFIKVFKIKIVPAEELYFE